MNRQLLRVGALGVCLALAAGIVGLASPARADVNVAIVVPAPYLVLSSDEKAVEHAIMFAMLAAFFDVDMDVVVVLGKRHSHADIAVILHLHRSSRRPIGYIERMRRRQGLGWGQIAHRLGVHPGTFNQRRVWAKKHDRGVADGYLWWVIGGHYGIPSYKLSALRKKGHAPAGVAMAANVAGHAHRPVLDVIRYRAGKHSWSAVGTRFGVRKAELKRAAAAKGHHPKVRKAKRPKGAAPGPGKKAPPAKGKGKGKGKKGKP